MWLTMLFKSQACVCSQFGQLIHFNWLFGKLPQRSVTNMYSPPVGYCHHTKGMIPANFVWWTSEFIGFIYVMPSPNRHSTEIPHSSMGGHLCNHTDRVHPQLSTLFTAAPPGAGAGLYVGSGGVQGVHSWTLRWDRDDSPHLFLL